MPTINLKEYKKIELLLNKRWCYLDEYGRKDQITLKTEKGQLITRTAQYYQFVDGEIKTHITYKGKPMMITEDYVLED
jgi:hypothetical protein